MKYSDGVEIQVGDLVENSEGDRGTVVCSFDTNQYSVDYTRENWGYLKRGVLVNFSSFGLIHYESDQNDFRLINQ